MRWRAFFAAAFGFARHQYDALLATGITFEHAWCGVSQIAYDDKSGKKIAQILDGAWPEELVSVLSAREMDTHAGLPIGFSGLHYPAGGWLCPAELTAAALQQAQQHGVRVHFSTRMTGLVRRDAGWQLTLNDQDQVQHAVVILANGQDVNAWAQTEHLPCYAVRGQVSHIPTTPTLRQLKQVLCYDGYLTPVSPQHQQHCIGASYQRGPVIHGL